MDGAQVSQAFRTVLGLDGGGEADVAGLLVKSLDVPNEVVVAADVGTIAPGDLAAIGDGLSKLAGAAPAGDLADRLRGVAAIYAREAGLDEGSRMPPDRLHVLSVAAAMIGRIKASEHDPDDPARRLGAGELGQVFEVALGDGKFDGNMVERLDTKEKLPAWCGLFVLWAYKTAGLGLGRWRVGVGLDPADVAAVKKEEVQPGDCGIIAHPFAHHFLVAGVDGDRLVTVEGNSEPQGGNDLSGGQVVLHDTRTLSGTTCFYRPKPWVAV